MTLYRRHALTLFNIFMFQLGWLICVIAGSTVALLFTAIVSCLHFYLVDNRRADLLMATVALLMGVIHDNTLMFAGVIDFPAPLAPVWILCLWWLMGLTLRHSLAYIYERPLLSAPLGAVAAALAYFGGVRLSDASWVIEPLWGIGLIAAIWLLVLPLHRFIIHISKRVTYAAP